MINQQLLDYIKHQLQIGLTKEKISNELLVNGWTLQDIEEGFKAVVVPAPTVTPPVSPYSGASYSQNTNPIKKQETQQQTFQPQIQQSPAQQTQMFSASSIHPFIRYGLIIGIIGTLFLISTFFFSRTLKIVLNGIDYFAVFEIAVILATVFCIMLLAKILKCENRTFVKALSVSGVIGIFTSLIYLSTLLKLTNFTSTVIFLLGVIFTLFFITKIYNISFLRAFFLWLLYVMLAGIVSIILFFIFGFSFFFSLANNIKDLNNADIIQQPITTEDQAQQANQNNNPQVLPNNTNNSAPLNQQIQSSSSYTNPTYGYSLKYPTGWKVDSINDDFITFSSNESFPSEHLNIYTYALGYNEATSESSLKSNNTIYQKTIINVEGVPSIKLTYDDAQKIGNYINNSRNLTLYILNKGKGGGELVVVGYCSTFGTSNSNNKCSNAIDGIMNDLVFPSISFKK